MKRIIRLTEGDLSRIVRRVIRENQLNELEKSTWGKIASDVEGRYPKLSKRIMQHSEKYGTTREEDKIILVLSNGETIEGIPFGRAKSEKISFDLEIEQDMVYVDEKDGEEKKGTLLIIQYLGSGDIELNFRNQRAYVQDKRSAKNLIKILGNTLYNPSEIDLRSFIEGYV